MDPDTIKRNRNELNQDDEDTQTYYAGDDDYGQEERKTLPQYVMHIVLDDKENDDASSMGFSTATKSVGSNRKGILKRNNFEPSDDDDSSESAITSFTKKSGATTRSVMFDIPKVCDVIEDELTKKGIAIERFRAWKEANYIEFKLILKLHSTTAHRVTGIRRVLRRWTGTAAAGQPSPNT